MKYLRSFILVLIISGPIFSNTSSAQSSLEQILSDARNFHDAVESADEYFYEKHGDFRPFDLTQGMYRDGEFVKYMRWRSFWEDRLNPDGTLGDISKYFRESEHRAGSGPWDDIEWTNVSYNDYMILQIGLGRTTSLAFHPTDENTFWVGAAIGGIWKTTDGGQTYTPLGDELPFLAVSGIGVNHENPDEIYIAISDHLWYGPPSIGVYKTIDGGETWNETSLTFDFTENIRVYSLMVDPSDGSRVFVGAADGLYRTDDGFETYEQVYESPVSDIEFDPSNSDKVYIGTNNGNFLISEDGGVTFDPIGDLGAGPNMIAVSVQDPDKVFVRSGSVLRRSYDGGLTFDSPAALPDNESILAFSQANDDILLSGWFDIWQSVDGGDSFNQISQWLGNDGLPAIHVDQRNVFVNPLQPNLIYLNNDGGLYTYNTLFGTFNNLCNGLQITQFYDIAVAQSDDMVIGAGSQDNGNVFRDSEGEWSQYAGTGDGMNQDIDPSNAGRRYWSYQFGSFHRWLNSVNVNISPPGENGNGAWEMPFKVDQNYSERLICGYNRVYESWNNGSTWESISDLLSGEDLREVALAKTNVNRVYAARSNTLYVKDVFSNDWESKPLPNSSISDLEVDPVNMDLIYISTAGYTEGEKVFRSFDAGTTWENISGSLPNVSTGAIEIYEHVQGGLFVGTDAGVFYRDNTMDDWEPYGDLPNTRVEDIEIQYDSHIIRVGTHGRGVLEASVMIGVCEDGVDDADGDGVCDDFDSCPGFDDSLLGTECSDGDPDTYDDVWIDCDVCAGVVSVNEIEDFPLSVYPNPNNGNFSVTSRKIQTGLVEVFDLLGKKVFETRFNGPSIDLDLEFLTPSVYNVRLTDSGELKNVQTSRVIIE